MTGIAANFVYLTRKYNRTVYMTARILKKYIKFQFCIYVLAKKKYDIRHASCKYMIWQSLFQGKHMLKMKMNMYLFIIFHWVVWDVKEFV